MKLHKDEARGLAGGAGLGEQGKSDTADSATASDARRKAFEGLRAQLALAGGHALHELSDGSYLVTRWNLSRPLADLAAAERFLAQVQGGRP